MTTHDEQAGLILLVEDNRQIAEMVGEFLEMRGYSVDYAADGVSGLHLAVSNSYDVALPYGSLRACGTSVSAVLLSKAARSFRAKGLPVLPNRTKSLSTAPPPTKSTSFTLKAGRAP